jgi:hypothetical protein
MNLNAHPYVRHPEDILKRKKEAKQNRHSSLYNANDKLLDWVTNHVLASVVLFDIALIVPLLVLPGPTSVKITLGVISGSWIQWWALPALQRSQNKTQAQNDAKAETDHETLTYLANAQDKQIAELKEIKAAVALIKNR